ncbi:MAG: hypothetical protein Q4B68_08045 [Bacteroidales bacterium]|nr:hypothetical protein [Bacteroidales bacterium]
MLKKLLLATLVAATALCASAEKKPSKAQIHLRSGQVVTGTITDRDERVVTITNDADGVSYHYTMDEINYIDHLTKKKNYDTSKFRGFIDLGYSMGVGEPRNDYWLVETSFGYAFTPRTYLGAGVAIHNFKEVMKSFPLYWDQSGTNAGRHNDPAWRYPFIPFYLEGRYSFMNESKHTPFVSMKVGGTFINHKGFFASPTLGYHFATNEFFSFNVGVCYELQTADYKLWCSGDSPSAIKDDTGKTYLKKSQAFHNLCIKVGVEF